MRPSWDSHFIRLAKEVASMGTCARRQVGCLLVDDRHVILATGLNGVPPGWEHCRNNPGFECSGARSASGTNLDNCLATHAEQNALIFCPDVTKIKTVYVTCSPCISCVKMLLCTNATRVVFEEPYSHFGAEDLWTRYSLHRVVNSVLFSGHRTWEQFQPDGSTKILGSSGLR